MRHRFGAAATGGACENKREELTGNRGEIGDILRKDLIAAARLPCHDPGRQNR
jgi:hypothetical protein